MSYERYELSEKPTTKPRTLDDSYRLEHAGRIMHFNSGFITEQKAWDTFPRIVELFREKFEVLARQDAAMLRWEECKGRMDDANACHNTIIYLGNEWKRIEFFIQEAFNFKRNVAFHRFWEQPACCCPVMDNEDRYGTGQSVSVASCLLHGWEEKETTNDL